MNLADVMDEIAEQLDTITGLRVFSHIPGALHPPAAVVAWPETLTFDETYGRGMDRVTIPVVVVVSKVTDRTARDRLAAYCAGSGASSVKAVLEIGTYTAFDTLRVVDVTFADFTFGDQVYPGALFSVDIAGKGA